MTAPLAERTGDMTARAHRRALSVSPRQVAAANDARLRLVGHLPPAEHDPTAATLAPGMLADLHEHLRVGANMLKALQAQIAHAERVLDDLERKRREGDAATAHGLPGAGSGAGQMNSRV